MSHENDPVTVLPGVGTKRAELFARLGIQTVGELLRFYPRDYDDRTRLVPICELEVDKPACFIASVVTTPQTHRIPKPGQRMLELTKLTVADHTARLNLTFFNAPYAASRLQRGETYCFYGTLAGDYLGYAMTNPLFEAPGEAGTVTRCIVPIYSLTAGLTNKMVMQAVAGALRLCAAEYPQRLPCETEEKYGLLSAQKAISQIHNPQSAELLMQARRRLAFEEFFVFSAALMLLRDRRSVHGAALFSAKEMPTFYKALPFSLTAAQQRALDEILSDLGSGRQMSRLLLGDVGSGKTVVAAASAWCAAVNGYQTALLAPTEILARQHYERLAPLFERLGVRCGLLVGSLSPQKKTALRAALADGTLGLVVGTHALLTESTEFSRLGLVIADEQHRFGVAQRAALLAKGDRPHLLLLSATPIPRTLALLLYGDLEVSVIDALPPGRKPVQTFLVDESYRKRLNAFVRRQAEEGHQSFIVCPAIEDDGDESVKAASQWAETLRRRVFPELRVALLHGRLHANEKEQIMTAFAAGEYDLLVATTVIEVGVDVANATLMLVENADRFGLSQLHQLRGRIGRGSAQSYCVLVSENRSPETLARLRVLVHSTDGFAIAQEDLKLRGPGDFFGNRQHGLPVFRMANLAQDTEVLRQAQQAAAEQVGSAETLPEALRREIAALLEQGEFSIN